MPIDTPEIIEFLRKVADEENLRVNVKESLKGGCIAGASATAGGIFLGPVGIAIGGVLGSLLAAFFAQGKFLPIAKVIVNMEEAKKESLAQNVRNIMNNLDASDMVVLAGMMAGNVAVRDRVVGELVDFFKTEMSMAIVDH